MTNEEGIIRSHNRGWRPQTAGSTRFHRNSQCAIFRTNCATLKVTNLRGHLQICVGLVWNFRDGRSSSHFFFIIIALLIFQVLNINLDIQCMHSGRISQCYISITRNAFIVKTSRSCDGPAVRIKVNKPKGKNMT